MKRNKMNYLYEQFRSNEQKKTNDGGSFCNRGTVIHKKINLTLNITLQNSVNYSFTNEKSGRISFQH